MKPSFFDKPEEIGETLYRRFYWPMEEQKRVVIGIPPQPEWNRQIIRGFLAGAAHEKKDFGALIAEQQMPDLDLSGLPPMEVVKVSTTGTMQAQVVDALNRFSKEGKRVLIYLPSVFSTHTLKDNTVQRIEAQLGAQLFSVSIAPLALRFEQEYLINPACVGSERDENGTAKYGCTVLKASRRYYRKKVPQERWVAIMDSPAPNDYLLMVSTPGQGADAEKENYDLRMDAPPASR